jgi:hypothetical protein
LREQRARRGRCGQQEGGDSPRLVFPHELLHYHGRKQRA